MMSRSGTTSNLPFSAGIPRGQIAVFFLILLVFVMGGAWFYFAQRDHLQREVEKDLEAISQLKTDQIVAWRSGQLIQGKIYADALLLAPETIRWLENPGSESAEPILKLFQSLQQPLRYDDIQLVDTGGRIVLSLRGQTGPIHASAVAALAEALRTRQGVLSDIHPTPGDSSGHIEAVMPLLAENGQPLGALSLLYSTREYLHPLIQSWPTASQTAETLLVRRDGDSVLFLNELRHQKDTALKLRIPLTQTEIPAVQAVLGKKGIVEGTDYRGIRVVSVLKPIPDSPWFMVAKMDWNEAFAAWRYRSIMILSLMGTFIVALAAVMGVAWQRRVQSHYKALYQAEADLRESEAKHHTTLLSIGDAVITTDQDGRVEFLNPVAETLMGWPLSEARGKPLDEIFHIINEQTRQPVENPVAKVLREGGVVGMANHTALIARDGTERPIADSGAPIRDEQGRIVGVVLVFRDQTLERQAEKDLRESEGRLKLAQFSAGAGMWDWDMVTGKFEWSDELFNLYGLDPRTTIAGFDAWRSVIHPDDRALAEKRIDEAIQNHTSLNSEYRIVLPSGEVRWVNALGNTTYDEVGSPQHISGICIDFTTRKRIEESLRESEERIQMALKVSASFTFEWEPATDRVLRSASCGPILGLVGDASEHDIGQHFFQRVHPEDRQRFVAMLGELKPGADTYRTEYRYVRGDGGTAVLEEVGRGFFDAGGALRRLIGITTDITERKKAEQEVHRSAERFAILSDTAGRLLQSKDPQVLIRTLCKKVMKHLDCDAFFNFLVDPAAGRLHLNAWEGIPEDQARKIEWLDYGVAVCGCAARDGCRIVAEHIPSTPDERTEMVKSFGIRAYACHPLLGPLGATIGTLSFGTRTRETFREDELSMMKTVADYVATSLTRLRYEESLFQQNADLLAIRKKLENEQRRMEGVMNVLPVGMAILDTAGGNIRSNKAFEEIWGQPRPPVRDIRDYTAYKAWWVDTGKPVEPDEWASAKAVRNAESVFNQFLKIQRFDGSTAYVLNSATPVLDGDGRVVAGTVAIQDVTALQNAQEVLRQSREDLDRAQAVGNIGSWRLDVQRNILTWSPEAYRIFGISEGTPLTYETFLSTIHPDDRDIVDTKWNEALRGGNYDVEHRIIAHGKTRWVREKAYLEFDTEGELIGGFGIAQDITERKKIEEDLRVHHIELEMQNEELSRAQLDLEASRQRYFDLYDMAPVGYFTFSETGLIQEANLTAASLLEVTREAMVNQPLTRYIFPDDQDLYYQYRRRLFETGLPQVCEIRMLRAVTEPVWVRMEAIVAHDIDGAVRGRVTLSNITERKEAQEAVLVSEVRYRRLFETARDGILILDANSGKIVDVNPFMVDMLGYSHKELLQKELWEIGLFKNIAATREAFHELQNKGYLRYENLPLKTQDGRLIVVEVVSNMYMVDHAKVIQCNIRDITDRVHAQEALRRSHDELERRVEERTRDLALTTQQLRALATELILTEERERRTVANALHDSLGPLLAFSKRELGTLRKSIPAQFGETLDHVRLQISQAVEQTRSLTIDLSPPTLYTLGLGHALEELGERFSAEHHVRCAFQNDTALPPLPDDIQVLLYRSVRELFVNIVKHAQATSVQLTLSMQDNHIRIAVEDDGVGIQEPSLHSPDEQQTGFGLFTIRQRLEQVGGQLEIQSANRKGTLVVIQVPLKATKSHSRRQPI